MKGLLMVSALALGFAAAGCATNSESNQASSQCFNLTGAALVECQKTVTPASDTRSSPFKMVKPTKGAGGMRGGMHN